MIKNMEKLRKEMMKRDWDSLGKDGKFFAISYVRGLFEKKLKKDLKKIKNEELPPFIDEAIKEQKEKAEYILKFLNDLLNNYYKLENSYETKSKE